MAHVAVLIPLLPLVGFLILITMGNQIKEPTSGWIATSVVGASFIATVIAFVLLLHRHSREATVNLFSWIRVGNFHVHVALLLDPLSITCLLYTSRCV